MDSGSNKIRFGQLNLQGSAAATMELPAIIQAHTLDLVLIQEPYVPQDATAAPDPMLLPAGASSKAAIYLGRRDIACSIQLHLCTSHCMVVHVRLSPQSSSFYAVSSYFQYSQDIGPHIHHLGRVLEALRGERVIIGIDSNAHSPMWFSHPRQYIGRGSVVTQRKEQLESFIIGRGLRLANVEGQPPTFATANGESHIDITLSTGGVRLQDWHVKPDASTSDHRLIVFSMQMQRLTGTTVPDASRSELPCRFRERDVDWERFQTMIHYRVGRIDWKKSAREVCKEFTDMVTRTAMECLGTCVDAKRNKGYEWWTPTLDSMRKKNNKLRKLWQSLRKRGIEAMEELVRMRFHSHRRRYRCAMMRAQMDFFHELANTGNHDPWGLAYRAACGRLRPPPNVIYGIKLMEGHACDTESAMHNMVRSLCPDDNASTDTIYHRQVRLLAACAPAGADAPPPSCRDLERIVKELPNTAPGIDGITARIVKNVWLAASSELTRIFGLCVEEGTFPEVWKDGRLIVLPKGNGKPLTDPKAYRPITLLSVLGKILERVILTCAPALTRDISVCQHGFTRGKSTLTALRSLQEVVATSKCKYVQAIFLDISGAFDNAWWPMILLKAKSRGCPPNIYRLLSSYFHNRRVGLRLGDSVAWKTATMGCPQGSVLGPSLWNLLMDDLFRLPYPEGVHLIAYADDVTFLVESNTRAGVEASASHALALASEWGLRNRLGFSPSKSHTMTLKGKLPGRPPVIRLGGESVGSVASARVLGVVVDTSQCFREHAQSIGERAAAAFGKMSRVSSSTWGVRYRALKVLYRGTYVATVTYAAGCWWHRTTTYVVRSALTRTQRQALILLTKAYRSVSSAALPVLAGVLPADLEVKRAGRIDDIRHLSREEFRKEKGKISEETVVEWQQRWEDEVKGRELYRYFPDVSARLNAAWVEPDYEVSQMLTGHGCFRKRLYEMKLCEVSVCFCGEDDESMEHVLFLCPLYREIRQDMMDGIIREEAGPIHYSDLVSSEANFRRFRKYVHRWHELRCRLETEERGTRGAGDEVA